MNSGLHRYAVLFFCAGVLGLCANAANAGVQEYHLADRDAWFADASAVGSITTIGFNDLGNNIFVTDQYAELGVNFSGDPNITRGVNFNLFPQDGWGLDGNELIRLVFDEPQIGLAFDLPGFAQVQFFMEGVLVYDSNFFANDFGGIFGVEFDEARIVDIDNNVVLDNLYFVSVPTPGVVAPFLMALFAFRSRRRRRVPMVRTTKVLVHQGTVRHMLRTTIALSVMAIATLSVSAHGGVQEYYTNNRDVWFADAGAVGSITTIGFNDLGNNIFVTDQYAELGVNFSGDPNITRGVNFDLFPQDGWGLDGNELIRLVFDELQIGLAFDLPGNAQVQLFLDGALVYDSNFFASDFGGVFGAEFDEAMIVDPIGQVALDDLHFVSIPVSGVVAPFLVSLLVLRSRRRTLR